MFTIKKEENQKEIGRVNFNNPSEFCIVRLKTDGKDHIVHNSLAVKLMQKGIATKVDGEIDTPKTNIKK